MCVCVCVCVCYISANQERKDNSSELTYFLKIVDISSQNTMAKSFLE